VGNINVSIMIVEEIFCKCRIYELCLYDEWLFFVHKDTVCSIFRLYC